MSKKITATNVLIAFVVLYGGYRVIRTQRRREQPALPPASRNPAIGAPAQTGGSVFTAQGQMKFVDWHERGTEENIGMAIEEALKEDGHRINSSLELAYAVGSRLWPGTSIHPAGLDHVRSVILDHFTGGEAEDDATHEATVRMAAKVDRTLEEAMEVYDGSIEADVLQDTLATAVFPEVAWPPGPDDPKWKKNVWDYCGALVGEAIEERTAPVELPDSSRDLTAPIEPEPPP